MSVQGDAAMNEQLLPFDLETLQGADVTFLFGDDWRKHIRLMMRREQWDQMGRPTTLLVAIENVPMA